MDLLVVVPAVDVEGAEVVPGDVEAVVAEVVVEGFEAPETQSRFESTRTLCVARPSGWQDLRFERSRSPRANRYASLVLASTASYGTLSSAVSLQ